MKLPNKLSDKFTGSLIGLAVGDALGAPIEFEKRDTYSHITSYQSGGPFNLKKGQWTDDTSLALCLGQSLIEKKYFDASDIMKRFHSWWREGYMSCTGHCFDIGNTTKAALSRFEDNGEIFSGALTDPATNGSIMRLAPVPLFYFNDLEKTLFYSGESSRLTHAPVECIDACRALGLFLYRALNGYTKEKILSYEKGELPELSPAIEKVLNGSYKNKKRDEISAAGLAVSCLEAALWSFYHSDNFNDGVLLAVNLGEDSDTTGAVFGQLAGAFYGLAGIKKEFVEGLWENKLLEKMALDIYHHHNSFFYEGENPTVDLIVVNPESEILLIKRSSKAAACAGMMAFPGGFIDSNAAYGENFKEGKETPEEAAIRELAEETNLNLPKNASLVLVGEYCGNDRDPRDNKISWSKTHAFLFRIDQKIYEEQKNTIRGMDDADEAEWVPLKKAITMKLAFDHNSILNDALKFLDLPKRIDK
jgi:ADP-ribosyl-[dinitrogen reductase] hydrolase